MWVRPPAPSAVLGTPPPPLGRGSRRGCGMFCRQQSQTALGVITFHLLCYLLRDHLAGIQPGHRVGQSQANGPLSMCSAGRPDLRQAAEGLRVTAQPPCPGGDGPARHPQGMGACRGGSWLPLCTDPRPWPVYGWTGAQPSRTPSLTGARGASEFGTGCPPQGPPPRLSQHPTIPSKGLPSASAA